MLKAENIQSLSSINCFSNQRPTLVTSAVGVGEGKMGEV